MSKRSVTEVQTATDGQAYPKVNSSGSRRDTINGAEEMGEFEDAWEDEIESDEEVVDAAEGNDQEGELSVLHGSITYANICI